MLIYTADGITFQKLAALPDANRAQPAPHTQDAGHSPVVAASSTDVHQHTQVTVISSASQEHAKDYIGAKAIHDRIHTPCPL